MASIKNHPFWNFPVIGVITTFLPVVIYEIVHLQTNVWLNSENTGGLIYSLSIIIGVITCSFSYYEIRKGNREWKYRLVFIILIIGFFIVGDIHKFGHAVEKSPVILEVYKTENLNNNYDNDEISILFRDNGTCRFIMSSEAKNEYYLETTYTQTDSIYTMNIAKRFESVIPSQLEKDDNLYRGQIHIYRGSKEINVYYKISSMLTFKIKEQYGSL